MYSLIKTNMFPDDHSMLWPPTLELHKMCPAEIVSPFGPFREKHARVVFLLFLLFASDKYVYPQIIRTVKLALCLEWRLLEGRDALLDFMHHVTDIV
jgi:hypothetical protein